MSGDAKNKAKYRGLDSSQVAEDFMMAARVLDMPFFSDEFDGSAVEKRLRNIIDGKVTGPIASATTEFELEKAIKDTDLQSFFGLFKEFILEKTRQAPRGEVAYIYVKLWQLGCFQNMDEGVIDRYADEICIIEEVVSKLRAIDASTTSEVEDTDTIDYIVPGASRMEETGALVSEASCKAILQDVKPLFEYESLKHKNASADLIEYKPWSGVYALRLNCSSKTLFAIHGAHNQVTTLSEDKMEKYFKKALSDRVTMGRKSLNRKKLPKLK